MKNYTENLQKKEKIIKEYKDNLVIHERIMAIEEFDDKFKDEKYFRELFSDSKELLVQELFLCDKRENSIGVMNFKEVSGEVYFSICILEEYRNTILVFSILSKIIDHFFIEKNLENIRMIVSKDNVKTLKLVEKFGIKYYDLSKFTKIDNNFVEMNIYRGDYIDD